MKWTIDDEKDLINLINKCNENGLKNHDAFLGHSKKYNRSVSAVKRRYYSLRPKGSKDMLKQALLDIESRNKIVNIGRYKKPVITEKDLQALFMGIVRLIKNNMIGD